MATYQFGYQHRLYLAYSLSGGRAEPQSLNTRPSDTTPDVTFNTAFWSLFDGVRDVEVGGTANTVDITTRDEARTGFSSEIDVTTSGTMTTEIRYRPTLDNVSTFGTDKTGLGYEALLKTWRRRTTIAAMDLDKEITEVGAQGLVANWGVTFTNRKEVQGVVIATVTFRLVDYADWIVQTSAGTAPEDGVTPSSLNFDATIYD